MKKTGILLAAALLTSGTVVGAAEPEAASSEAPEKEKKICKTEKVTGSLTRVTRTCLTQRQWDRLAEITRKGVRDLENDANQSQAARASLPPPGVGAGGF